MLASAAPIALTRWALRRPRAVLACCALFVAALAPGLAKLRLDTDGRALLPESDEAVRVDAAVRERFDLRDVVAVVVERQGPNGVFEADALDSIGELSALALELPGVTHRDVSSLSTERSDRVRPGSLEFRSWLDPPPATRAELDRLRADLEQVGVWRGTLLSVDQPPSASAVLVRVPPAVERTEWISRVREQAARVASSRPQLTLHVVGAPVVEAELGGHVVADLRTLLPICVAALCLAFWLAFRTPSALWIPALEVGCAIVCVLGALGWSGHPLQISTAVVPVILAALGVTDEVHVLTELRRVVRERPELEMRAAVELTMERLASALAATSLTTAAGLGVFALAPIASLRAFGAMMAGGAVFCLLWSLAATPALLARTSRGAWIRTDVQSVRFADAVERRFANLARWSLARRPLVLGATALVAAIGGASALTLRIDDSWIGSFAPSSEVRRSSERVDELFGGVHLLHLAVGPALQPLEGVSAADAFGDGRVEIELDPQQADSVELRALAGARLCATPIVPGEERDRGEICARVATARRSPAGLELELDAASPSVYGRLPSAASQVRWRIDAGLRMLQPDATAAMGRLEAALAARDDVGVGRVLGLHEHLATMNFLLHGRDESRRTAPTSAETPALLHHYRRVRGEHELARIVTPEGDEALLTVFLRRSSFARTGEVLAALESAAERELQPLGLRVELAGDVALSQSLVGRIVRGQTESLGLALVAVTLVAAAWLRSARLALWSAAPAAVGVLANFGALAAVDGALGVATSMFAATTLGVGVDYALHFASRARRLRSGDRDLLARAAGETAAATLVDAAAVGFAFGLLALSNTPANSRLGLLVACGVAAAFLASALLMPIAYAPLVRSRSS